jgi:hypothetical protein
MILVSLHECYVASSPARSNTMWMVALSALFVCRPIIMLYVAPVCHNAVSESNINTIIAVATGSVLLYRRPKKTTSHLTRVDHFNVFIYKWTAPVNWFCCRLVFKMSRVWSPLSSLTLNNWYEYLKMELEQWFSTCVPRGFPRCATKFSRQM